MHRWTLPGGSSRLPGAPQRLTPRSLPAEDQLNGFQSPGVEQEGSATRTVCDSRTIKSWEVYSSIDLGGIRGAYLNWVAVLYCIIVNGIIGGEYRRTGNYKQSIHEDSRYVILYDRCMDNGDTDNAPSSRKLGSATGHISI